MISFIIPAYNAENGIKRCICSIAKQITEENYEIIVVDDGSIDNTIAKVKGCIEEYPQVRLIEKENGGVSSARNTGIENAKGEYIIFCDADDSLENGFFEMIAGYESHDLTVFGYNYIVQNKNIPVTGKANDIYDIEKVFLELYESRLFNPVWNKIYKKSLIMDLFENEFSVGEDLLFNIKYLKNISNVHCIASALYNYTVTSGSITQSYKDNYADNFSDCFNALKDLKKELGSFSCDLIEKDYIDNIVGTINLLINFSKYSYKSKLREMEKITKKVEKQKIGNYYSSKYNKMIMRLLFLHSYFLVFAIMKLKIMVKAMVKK